MPGSAEVLVIMAKYPSPGAVKTRLAERVGAAEACELYRAFLADLAARYAAAPWRLVWAVTPGSADLSPFVGGAGEQIAQEGDGLGERMRRCFARLGASGAERVVMIGADVPHIGEDVIAAAFAALEDGDAVLGPTRDGGYCLVGLRAPHDIFSDVPMGTGAVFARTCARLDALGVRWRTLRESFDVDTLDDVGELHELIARGDVALPHTASVLRAWQAAGWLS
jgi:rSAM/selenodomain-associated transferase 1